MKIIVDEKSNRVEVGKSIFYHSSPTQLVHFIINLLKMYPLSEDEPEIWFRDFSGKEERVWSE